MSIYDDTNLGDHPCLKFAISLYFYSYITRDIEKKKSNNHQVLVKTVKHIK